MRIVIYSFLLFLLLVALLHIPSVQTGITNSVVKRLNKSVNGTIVIESSKLNIYKGIELKGIRLEDSNQFKLMALDQLTISPRSTLLSLLSDGLSFNDLVLNDATIWLIRETETAGWNWENLIDTPGIRY